MIYREYLSRLTIFLIIPILLIVGCASSIVNGQRVKTTSMDIEPKPKGAPIDLYFSNQNLSREYTVVGKVIARSWLLEKGIEELKNQARKLGADAVIDVKYERKISIEYLQDLFNISGDAVIWKE